MLNNVLEMGIPSLIVNVQWMQLIREKYASLFDTFCRKESFFFRWYTILLFLSFL